ncbi:hypothetical protein [Natronorubrum tibetense]|uniref:hypothetical protein n=1 Tax=Natronorubrum tibetense TaxID=63128 RepID=UPI000361063C|nr:hypothetical protein [Natronorubrum tibetense]
MSGSGPEGGLVRALLCAEGRLHETAPIKESHSKLLVRSVFWFLLFSGVYTVVSGIL